MLFKEISIQDKLGRTVVLRNARPEDSEDLIKYLKKTCGETPYLIREPDEITITEEKEKQFIQAKIDDERELLLVAFIDGKHVGNCSLMSIAPYRRYSHRCDIAIALYKEYCGCGIGKAMLQTVLNVAKSVGYEQAELEVMAENKDAIAMYEKLGFKKFGTFPDNMKYADESYMDAYWMMKKL
ncbi:MAG: GNAT family N-acetyltransferase [Lachnospiraceae bacterium]|nr:GNAT family N-acetyltransferase [Lachnospiraceae bacterium]MBP5414222.1 GNAT family N-acetyltransferase [Lachnospiraceae bacterium]